MPSKSFLIHCSPERLAEEVLGELRGPNGSIFDGDYWTGEGYQPGVVEIPLWQDIYDACGVFFPHKDVLYTDFLYPQHPFPDSFYAGYADRELAETIREEDDHRYSTAERVAEILAMLEAIDVEAGLEEFARADTVFSAERRREMMELARPGLEKIRAFYRDAARDGHVVVYHHHI